MKPHSHELKLGVQHRVYQLDRASLSEESRTVNLSFSSEDPYERYWGIEILGHAEGEADFKWLNGGTAPLLKEHNRDAQIGVIESAGLSGARGVATIRFSKSAAGESELQEVRDGIRSNISVGYRIKDLLLVKEEDGVPTYRVTSWQALEVSTVSIPADTTVGIGRAATAEQDLLPVRIVTRASQESPPAEPVIPTLTPATKTVALKISPTPKGTKMDPTIEEIRAEERKQERTRTQEIRALAGRHNIGALGEEHVDKGTDIATFRGIALDEIAKQGSAKPLYKPVSEIGLTPKETARFSVCSLLARAMGVSNIGGFEAEASAAVRAAQEAAGIVPAQGKSMLLPMELMDAPLPGVRAVDGRLMIGDHVINARDLATTPVAAGGALVATDLLATSFVELLRNATLLRSLGCTYLPGLQGLVNIPRQLTAVTPGWVGQAVGATESDSSYGVIAMSPKTLHAIQDITRELILQGTPGIEGLVRADLIASLAVMVDQAGFHGTGAGSQPTGLFATAGIGSIAGGVNGLAANFVNLVGLETVVSSLNANQGRMAYATNTKVRGQLKTTLRFAGVAGEIWQDPIPGDDPSLYGRVNMYRTAVSNTIRSDLVKGTSGAVCSAVAFGNWVDFLIGQWGAVELLVDEVTQAANRIKRLHVYQTMDFAVRRPQSFAATLDVLAP
jgi:HK97 family phage major capsid protein